jgi:hypothetical protein
LEVVFAKAAELGGVVMLAWIAAAGVYLDCKKRNLEERVRVRLWNA